MVNQSNKSKELYLGLILSYVTTFVSLGVSLVLTPLIIRFLGQSEYGLYETIGSFVSYLSVLDLGFGSVVTRYTAKFQNENNIVGLYKFLYTCRNVYLILCGVIIIIGLILYNFIDTLFSRSFSPLELNKAHILFIMVLATTVISIYSQVYKGLLNGIEKFIWPRVIHLLKIIFTKVVAVTILYFGSDSIGLVGVMLVFEVLSCIVLMFKAHSLVNFVPNKMPHKQLKELFAYTGYLFILAIVSQLYWQIDKFLLGVLSGTICVAIYSAALNVQNILRNVSSSLKEILIPRISHISSDDFDLSVLLTNFMIKSGRIILIVYGILLVGFTIVGDKFIILWLGDEYAVAYQIVIILGYSTLLPTILLPGEEICKTYNKHGQLTYIYLFVAVINIILSYFMIKGIGIMGAAISTSIGLIIGNVCIALFYYKKVFGIDIYVLFKGLFNRIISVLILTAIIGFGINSLLREVNWGTLFLEVFIIGLIYIILLFLIGFNSTEKELFSKFLCRFRK